MYTFSTPYPWGWRKDSIAFVKDATFGGMRTKSSRVNFKSEMSTAREGNEGAQGKSPLERSWAAAEEHAQAFMEIGSIPRKDCH
jgi:hypothetical protein